jgi:hypothetical protein
MIDRFIAGLILALPCGPRHDPFLCQLIDLGKQGSRLLDPLGPGSLVAPIFQGPITQGRPLFCPNAVETSLALLASS